MSDVFQENREKLLEYFEKDPKYNCLKTSIQHLARSTNNQVLSLPKIGTFSMQDVLAEIQKRKVSVDRADICVHPKWAADVYDFVIQDQDTILQATLQEISDAFQVALSNILKTSPQAIIINTPDDHNNIHAGKLFNSTRRLKKDEETGELPLPELARLLLETEIGPESNLLFHGAEYGRCPTLTAQQLFFSLKLGIAIPLEEGSQNDVRIYVSTLPYIMPLIHQSRFRMGTLFEFTDEDQLYPITVKLTQAMHGDQTRIYPDYFFNPNTRLK